MCSAWRSSLWRWDAAAREGPCEGHKGLADETGERVRFCGALLLDAVGTCCAARVALLWCEPRFPDACAAGAEAIRAAREPGARALGRAGAVRPLSMRRCNGAPAMRGVMIAEPPFFIPLSRNISFLARSERIGCLAHAV